MNVTLTASSLGDLILQLQAAYQVLSGKDAVYVLLPPESYFQLKAELQSHLSPKTLVHVKQVRFAGLIVLVGDVREIQVLGRPEDHAHHLTRQALVGNPGPPQNQEEIP